MAVRHEIEADSSGMITREGVLLVGLGSAHGDDQIGWIVSRRIASEIDGLKSLQLATPIDLLNVLADVERLVIVDACRGQSEVGTLHRWQWPTVAIATVQAAGTHSIGLPEVLQMAERLGLLPSEVIVWGIEGRRFSPENEMTPELESSIENHVAQIAADCIPSRSSTNAGG